MHTLVQYLFETSVCLIALYAFYHFFLKKETFFQLNRIYLLSSPFLAFIIPLVNIDLSTAQAAEQLPILYPIVSNANSVQQQLWTQMTEPTPAFQLTLADLLFIIYLLGVFIMTTRLGVGLGRLFRLIRKSQRAKLDRFTLVETDASIPASSFFSYIFWNNKKLTDEQRVILEHEMVHVRQKHSLDVLIMECWVIIKWFNPLIYWFRNSLRETHEYIADRYMATEMGSAYQYASLLATQLHLSASCNPLVNNFAALIRNRLKMLARTKSSYWKYSKYAISIPVVLLLMMLFSFNLIDQLPSQLTGPFKKVEDYIGNLTDQTILEIAPSVTEEANALFWGNRQIPIGSLNEQGDISLEIIHISPDMFQELMGSSPFLIGSQYRVPFNRITAQAFTFDNRSLFSAIRCEDAGKLLQQFNSLGNAFTLYLRFECNNDKNYYCILNITNNMAFVDYPEGLFEFILQNGANTGADSYSRTICTYPAEHIWDVPTQQTGPFLQIGDQKIKVIELPNEAGYNPPSQSIDPVVLKNLLEEIPKVWVEDKELEVSRIALSLKCENDNYDCDIEPGKRMICLEELIAQADSAESVTFLLRTEKERAFMGKIVWRISPKAGPDLPQINSYLKEKIPSFTQRTVIPPSLPRPAFHESGLMLKWGSIQIPVPKLANSNSYHGTISLSMQDFQQILYEDISAYSEDQALSIIGFMPTHSRSNDLQDLFSVYRWYMQETGSYPENLFPVLNPEHVDLILQKVGEGYNVVSFTIHLEEEGSPASYLNFTVKIHNDVTSNPEIKQEGILIDPGVNEFQLINRAGKPTIIKIDTTNHKYRWMYEMYKDKPEVQVYHIPEFKTINRVITLDDALFPATTLEQRKVLFSDPKNIDQLAEFYDFRDNPVLLKWGTLRGVDDQTVYDLKTFKKASEKPLELQVAQLSLPIRQFDLVFVPEKGDVKRFVTDRTDYEALRNVIRKMGPKTSVLITNLVVEQERNKPLYFPLTFAFHLN